MGRAWFALLLLGACGSDTGTVAAEQSACETKQSFLPESAAPFDIIVLLDPKAPTAVPDFDAQLRGLLDVYQWVPADLHILVAGALGTCTTDGLPFLTSRARPEAPPATNFARTLGDAMACLGESQIDIYFGLDRALLTPGFRHGGDHGLGLIVIDSQGSAQQLPDGLAFTLILGPPETAASWIGKVGKGNVRFAALASDWSDDLASFFGFFGDTGAPCITGPVVSPAECVVTETNEITGAAEILRYCPDRSGPRPCWWDDPAPTAYTCPGGFAYHVERDEYASYYSVDDVRCPLTCP